MDFESTSGQSSSAMEAAEIVELKPCVEELNNSADSNMVQLDMVELNEVPPEVGEIKMKGSNVSITPRSLICVELPVKVDNPEKIIGALGGRQVLLDTFNDVGTSQFTKRRLNFSFRPDDPHAHAACGDPCITENALVLIQKLRSKKDPKKTKMRMKIVGCSSIAYKFQAPADCQQLPVLPFENEKAKCVQFCLLSIRTPRRLWKR
ncbi:Oidioi.mRNA.OKI2018_I69.XSR.g13407.t1.cds [Oikopleura dioica]|uniref:Oidioi.mRNA.OKI2018_I69.XSR.g13407.t1.cds n=1 Tax=Oikopleura dioica TaxID=34765 RepID=A0ABN7S6S1_OIKDI|nr:Oidioi.mRNA.OKI2018_I69.XSR.g13407.t1.cds [Oikopleura dioica]